MSITSPFRGAGGTRVEDAPDTYDPSVLAYAGEIDGLAVFLFPIVFGLGFLLLTRKRKHADVEGQNGSPEERTTRDEPPRILARRKDPVARLRSLMDAQSMSDAGEPPRIRARRKDPVARLRSLMDGDAGPAPRQDDHTGPESA